MKSLDLFFSHFTHSIVLAFFLLLSLELESLTSHTFSRITNFKWNCTCNNSLMIPKLRKAFVCNFFLVPTLLSFVNASLKQTQLLQKRKKIKKIYLLHIFYTSQFHWVLSAYLVLLVKTKRKKMRKNVNEKREASFNLSFEEGLKGKQAHTHTHTCTNTNLSGNIFSQNVWNRNRLRSDPDSFMKIMLNEAYA
jgi:hypothetical protein